MGHADLRPTTSALAALVRGVRADQLSGPTPCPAYSVADLLDHIGGMSVAFTHAATKDDRGGQAPDVDGSRLEDGWRDRIAGALDELGEAWQDPGAYDGVTMAGPVELPADQAALVALDEVTVHAVTSRPRPGSPTRPTRPPSRRARGSWRPAHRGHRSRPGLEALSDYNRLPLLG